MDSHSDDLTGSEVVIGGTLEEALELGDKHDLYVNGCKDVSWTASACELHSLFLSLDNGEAYYRVEGGRAAVIQGPYFRPSSLDTSDEESSG